MTEGVLTKRPHAYGIFGGCFFWIFLFIVDLFTLFVSFYLWMTYHWLFMCCSQTTLGSWPWDRDVINKCRQSLKHCKTRLYLGVWNWSVPGCAWILVFQQSWFSGKGTPWRLNSSSRAPFSTEPHGIPEYHNSHDTSWHPSCHRWFGLGETRCPVT